MALEVLSVQLHKIILKCDLVQREVSIPTYNTSQKSTYQVCTDCISLLINEKFRILKWILKCLPGIVFDFSFVVFAFKLNFIRDPVFSNVSL